MTGALSRVVGILALAALLAVACTRVAAESSGTRDTTASELKGAFLLNFIRFVQWPPSPPGDASAELVVGIVGDDPFEQILDNAVAGKKFNGRDVRIERLGANDRLTGLHVLFVSGSEKARVRDVLERVGAQSILTVSDVEGFSKKGGVIELVMTDDRLQFEINLASARRGQLHVSSKLIALARAVRDPK